MMRFRFAYKETIVTILTESEKYYEVAVEAILEARSEIESYIAIHPEFLVSYEPIECEERKIISEMCRAAKIANVGPMASVAGTIASYAVNRMVEDGASFAVVDNGGDIAMCTNRELLVGIYPSDLALRIGPKKFYAICTSSGKIGHSVSFGYADAATILGKDASVADALATALCNRIKAEFGREDLEATLREFYDDYRKYIDGAIVIKDDLVAIAGSVPQIVKASIEPELITKG